MQEAFLSAFRAVRLYRGGSFIAWLLRITNNKCLDWLRARGRRPSVSLDADDGERTPLQLREPVESPEQRVLRAELAESLELVLQEIAADQRLVVILSDIQGQSHEEIVATTGWPAGTVKSRLSRGRARLRDALRSTDFSSRE